MSKALKKTLPQQNNLVGILYIMAHILALSLLYVINKELTSKLNLSSNLAVFLYKFSILIIILPWCLKGGIATMKTDRLGLHAIRGVLSICGSLCMFYAVKHIALSDITAIQYLEHILLMIIGIVFFHETFTKTKVVVILFSILGASMVIRPDLYDFANSTAANSATAFNHYYLFVFAALLFWSMNTTVVKLLGRTEKTKAQLFYTTFFSCIFALPITFMDWQTVSNIDVFEIRYPARWYAFSELNLQSHHIPYILALAICYFVHAATHFKAFKHAEISVVVPFEYTRLIFAGIFGYWLFGEVPTDLKIMGYVLITAAGIVLLKAEHKRRKRAKLVAKDEFSQ